MEKITHTDIETQLKLNFISLAAQDRRMIDDYHFNNSDIVNYIPWIYSVHIPSKFYIKNEDIKEQYDFFHLKKNIKAFDEMMEGDCLSDVSDLDSVINRVRNKYKDETKDTMIPVFICQDDIFSFICIRNIFFKYGLVCGTYLLPASCEAIIASITHMRIKDDEKTCNLKLFPKQKG
jgi:hypothetical protein